jgi:uncharacterized protein
MGIPAFILDRSADLAALCQRRHARQLDLFGSAVRQDYAPERSDLDFIVSFNTLAPADYADAFFSLKQDLETLFHRPVDLLTEHALRNPHLRDRVNAERLTVYGG